MALGMYICGHSHHHNVNILSRRHNPNLNLDESKVAKCRLHLSCNQGGATSFEFWHVFLQHFCLNFTYVDPVATMTKTYYQINITQISE